MNVASQNSSRGRSAVWVIMLLILATLPFLTGLSGDYVYDDFLLIKNNPVIQDLTGFSRAFTSGFWDFLDQTEAERIGHWRPLTGVCLTAAYNLGGGELWVFHVISLPLHLACTLVFYVLFRRILKSQAIAFFAALLFAIHPAHVESVCWASALNDPLSGLFSAFSLLGVIAWQKQGGKGIPWVTGLWLFAALLSKETAIALVAMVVVLEVGSGGSTTGGHGRWVRSGRLGLPLVMAMVVWWLARCAVFNDWAGGFGRGCMDFGFGPWRESLFRFELFGEYLRILALPVGLKVINPVSPDLDQGAILPIFLTVSYLLLLYYCPKGPLRRGLLLIPAGLLPVLLAATSLGRFPLADRYLYLPVLGMVWFLASFFETRLPRRLALGLMIAIVLLLGLRAGLRTNVWADHGTFFHAATREAATSPFSWWNRGKERLERFQEKADQEKLSQSRVAFTMASQIIRRTELEPGYAFVSEEDRVQTGVGLAYCNLAMALNGKGAGLEKVKQEFLQLTRTYPENPYVWNGLGMACVFTNNLVEAEASFKKALTLAPHNRQVIQNLARLKKTQK